MKRRLRAFCVRALEPADVWVAREPVKSVAPALDENTVELGVQLAASAGLLLVMVVIHTVGLLLISNVLKLDTIT